MSFPSSSIPNITTDHRKPQTHTTIHSNVPLVIDTILTNTYPSTNITSQAMSSATQQNSQKQQTSASSRVSMSSYDAASIMSEKERASASWREAQDKKESKLSRFITAIKNIEPPEPVLPKHNRTSIPGWAR